MITKQDLEDHGIGSNTAQLCIDNWKAQQPTRISAYMAMLMAKMSAMVKHKRLKEVQYMEMAEFIRELENTWRMADDVAEKLKESTKVRPEIGVRVIPVDRPDPVNNPRHYNSHPSGVECLTIVRHMNFNLGNAIKYLWRSDKKGAQIQDLQKAIFYINDEIKRLEDNAKNNSTIPASYSKS